MKKIYFKNFSELWLQAAKGTVKGNTYRNTYQNIVYRHLNPVFGEMFLDEINVADLQLFLNKQIGKYKKDTVIKMRRILKKIFIYAVDYDYIIKNPTLHLIVSNDGTEEVEVPTYSQSQVDLIIDFAEEHRFGKEILTLLDTGMRRCELLGLKWSDFDNNKRVIKIRRSVADVKTSDEEPTRVVVGKTKTPTSKRDIPLSDFLCRCINKIPKNSEYIFPNKFGEVQSPSTWSKKHYNCFMKEMHNHYLEKQIDIPILSAHKLRHTRASLWVNSGKNIYAIAKVLGHSDLEMLQKRYAHSNVEQLRNLLDI